MKRLRHFSGDQESRGRDLNSMTQTMTQSEYHHPSGFAIQQPYRLSFHAIGDGSVVKCRQRSRQKDCTYVLR
jgi:hypothetical protein